jgi:outer membrane protein OmpA-like peptidoglycan-associated protein
MKRQITATTLLSGVLLLSLVTSDVMAQQFRTETGWYISPRVGINTYIGDRDDNQDFFDYFQRGGMSFGVEIGRGMPWFGPNVGATLGLLYIAGEYPHINDNHAHIQPDLDQANSSTWRHTIGLLTRATFVPAARVSPYVQLGLGATLGNMQRVGEATDEWSAAFSPVVGLGLDIAFTERIGVFLEVSQILAIPQDRVDLAEQNPNRGGFADFLGFYGGGLRFNVTAPFVPVGIISIDGPSELNVGQTGTFTARVEPGYTEPARYVWQMGDGTTLEGRNVSHAYANPGTYTVRFTAEQARATDTRTMTVRVIAPARAEIVSMTADPMSPDTQTPVRFSANVRGDAPISYQWNFGDGNTSTQQNPTHTYATPGTYTVNLTATNPHGTDSRTMSITVRPFEAPICAQITELNSVFFAPNSSTLTEEGRAALRENIEILRECPNISVRLEGYAGPGERNPQQLSEARVRAVQQYYLDQGVTAGRITTRAHGLAAGVTAKDAAAQWRRVDSIPVR